MRDFSLFFLLVVNRMREDVQRVNRNIEKINEWFKEEGITESRKQALERTLTVMFNIKETIQTVHKNQMF